MIFVTVGTHEQPFNRLIKCMDRLVETEDITEEVMIQTGYSTYEPQYCKWRNFFPYREMQKYIEKARVVITHGGPSSFIAPLRIGKIPIVVPRRHEFNEHVNNHQVDFCNAVRERMGTIIVVEEIDKLGGIIKNYNKMVSTNKELSSNNDKFCLEFEKIVNEIKTS